MKDFVTYYGVILFFGLVGVIVERIELKAKAKRHNVRRCA
jgi:hypothetical protein